MTALTVGAGPTVVGLLGMVAPAPDVQSLGYFLLPALIVAVAWCEWMARRLGVNRIVAASALAALVALGTGNAGAFVVVVLFAAACFVVGRACLQLMGCRPEASSASTCALAGAAVYGTVVHLAAAFPIAYPATYALGLVVPLLLGRRHLRRAWEERRVLFADQGQAIWLDLAIALLALYYFGVALMPEVGHDALVTHLFVPTHLASRHEWRFDVTTYAFAVMPMLGDWLFAIGQVLSGETAARLVNVGFVFLICWQIVEMVRWGGGDAKGGRWAVLLFLSTPLTFTEASSLFIESIWTAFVLAGFLSVLRLASARSAQQEVGTLIVTSGVMLGAQWPPKR